MTVLFWLVIVGGGGAFTLAGISTWPLRD